MNKIIVVLAVAAIALGLWKFGPEVSEMFGKAEDEDGKKPVPQGRPEPEPAEPDEKATGTPNSAEVPAQREEIPVALLLYAKLDTTAGRLRYIVHVPSLLRDAVFQYRGGFLGRDATWEKLTERLGAQQFTFTSPQNVAYEVGLEIQLDPGVQTPEIRKIIGENGELLTGPFVVKQGMTNVVRAVARFVPGRLTFTDSVMEEIPLVPGR